MPFPTALKKMPGLQDAKATIKFVKIFKLFDILHSTSILQKGDKRPIHLMNSSSAKGFLDEMDLYIQHLCLGDGTPVCESARKTGFLDGLRVCMLSAWSLFEKCIV